MREPHALGPRHGDVRAVRAGESVEFRDALTGAILFEYVGRSAEAERWCGGCRAWIPVRGPLGALAFEVEHPGQPHPSDEARRRLAECYPGALVLPAPAIVRLVREEIGAQYAVLAPIPPPPGASWRVVLRGSVLATGATAQEAVERALEEPVRGGEGA